ncbi:MAG TPA: hypothetical protein VJ242_01115, partial [Patescibacteria group bacterium]|nr:hypothetical protein [Patescibacteria group bacterium]
MPELQEEQIPVYQPQPTPPKWLLIAGGFVTILLLFGLGFWLGKGKPLPPKPTPIDPGQVLADRFSQPVAAPGQITFIFFNDANRNGVFDQNELGYSNVSVELRRRGQPSAFQTVPADTQGRVTV